MDYNLGFIGGGNMSTAIVRGILKHNAHPPSKIWVSGPRLPNIKHWDDMGTNVTTENSKVVSNCDIVFLGVKPGLLSQAVKDCRKGLEPSNKHVTFVSMLAGITIKELHEQLSLLKGCITFGVIRIMPNTPMSVGAGSCLYTADDMVQDTEISKLEKLLNCCGISERVSENLMASLGSLIGCGPAFMYIVIEALADGAVKQGVPRASALKHAAQMVVGSGEMVLQSGKHPGLLKDEVCSPGGSTICGVTALENGKLRATLISAIEAASLRTLELGKK